MTPSSQPEPRFLSKEAKYAIFNFHREGEIRRLVDLLSQPGRPASRVIVLSGEAGVGRKYFLESAIHRAAHAGRNIRLVTLDLHGLEPQEPSSFEQYARQQLERLSAATRTKAAAILNHLKLKLKGPAIPLTSSFLFSLSVELDLPLAEISALIPQTFDSLPSPKVRSEREKLYRLIRYLAAKEVLVIHCHDGLELSAVLRGWLLDAVKIIPRLVLVFSVPGNASPTEFRNLNFMQLDAERFELRPFTKSETREIVDSRFEGNLFPADFYSVLYQYSKGLPGRLALKFTDLVSRRLVDQHANSQWYLTTALDSPPFLEEFDADLYQPIEQFVAHQAIGHMVKSFLFFAALCGDTIPVTTIGKLVGLAGDKWNDLLDAIDEAFPNDTLFRDLGYRHPSFKSDELIYQFASPLVRGILLERVSTDERADLALKLLNHFEQFLPIITRGIARLYLEVASFLTSGPELSRYEHELDWWISLEEADEFTQYMTTAVKGGRILPTAIVSEVSRNRRLWPPYKSLAILAAIATDDVPSEMLGSFLALRGELLFYSSRYEEAFVDADAALHLAGTETDRGVALTLRGLVSVYMAQYRSAAVDLREALDITIREMGLEHQSTATTLDNLVRALSESREYQEAVPLAELALNVRTKISGAKHVDTTVSMTNLARLYLHNHDFERAAPLAERAFEIREATLGLDHQDTISALNNLAVLYTGWQRYDQALIFAERAVAQNKRVLGPEHFNTAQSLENLGTLYVVHCRYHDATRTLEQAAAAFQASVGPHHPKTVTARVFLEMAHEKLRASNQ